MESVNERIYSATFYTENFGYKLTTLFYPNGLKAEKNNFLSIYIAATRGKNNAILPVLLSKGK